MSKSWNWDHIDFSALSRKHAQLTCRLSRGVLVRKPVVLGKCWRVRVNIPFPTDESGIAPYTVTKTLRDQDGNPLRKERQIQEVADSWRRFCEKNDSTWKPVIPKKRNERAGDLGMSFFYIVDLGIGEHTWICKTRGLDVFHYRHAYKIGSTLRHPRRRILDYFKQAKMFDAALRNGNGSLLPQTRMVIEFDCLELAPRLERFCRNFWKNSKLSNNFGREVYQVHPCDMEFLRENLDSGRFWSTEEMKKLDKSLKGS